MKNKKKKKSLVFMTYYDIKHQQIENCGDQL